jgi:hypothetical protein
MDYATTLTAAWMGIHLIGLVAAWGLRMHCGGRFESLTQTCFLMSLLLVSVTTLVGHVCSFELWHLSAATLAMMILLAVIDFRLDRPLAAGI